MHKEIEHEPRLRFEAGEVWALVPGPAEVSESVHTNNVHGPIASHAPSEVATWLLRFPGVSLTHREQPDWQSWTAELRADEDILRLKMTLQDNPPVFGGFIITADCPQRMLFEVWEHIRRRFPAVWLFAPDLQIYSPEGFAKAISASGL